MQAVYDFVVRGVLDEKTLTTNSNCWIDVRDIALAHVLAAEKPAAGGERIIVCGGNFLWQDFCASNPMSPPLINTDTHQHYIVLTVDTANAIDPPIIPNLPKGKPGATKGLPPDLSYDISEGERILGLDFKKLGHA